MDKKALEMRRIITTIDLRGDQLLLMNEEMIAMWIKACDSLIGLLKTEEMLLTTVHAVAKVKDDIQMAQKNMITLKAVDKLKELELDSFIGLS